MTTAQQPKPWTPEQQRKLLEALALDPTIRAYSRLISNKSPRFALTPDGCMNLRPPVNDELRLQFEQYQQWLVGELVRMLGGSTADFLAAASAYETRETAPDYLDAMDFADLQKEVVARLQRLPMAPESAAELHREMVELASVVK